MSFLEEHPGPLGKLEIDAPEPDEEDGEPPKKWRIWLAIGLGLLLVIFGVYVVFSNLAVAGVGPVLVKLIGLAVYMLISHFVTATPDYSNVGWLGGWWIIPFGHRITIIDGWWSSRLFYYRASLWLIVW